MSALQWALLLLGIGGIIVLIVSSRRERRPAQPSVATAGAVDDARGADAGGFDEFGVGKARRRGGATPRAATPQRIEPVIASYPAPASAEGGVSPIAQEQVPEKIVALFIAEHEGTKILGPRLHAALNAQGLSYNERNKAYDRLDGKAVSYSVTSLTAPGHLDPAEAPGFSTPGLAMFMRLPGPADPGTAFRDMLKTANALALSLNALVFDPEQKPLTEERLGLLAADVDAWAQRYGR